MIRYLKICTLTARRLNQPKLVCEICNTPRDSSTTTTTTIEESTTPTTSPKTSTTTSTTTTTTTTTSTTMSASTTTSTATTTSTSTAEFFTGLFRKGKRERRSSQDVESVAPAPVSSSSSSSSSSAASSSSSTALISTPSATIAPPPDSVGTLNAINQATTALVKVGYNAVTQTVAAKWAGMQKAVGDASAEAAGFTWSHLSSLITFEEYAQMKYQFQEPRSPNSRPKTVKVRSPACQVCKGEFGLGRYSYHCASCGHAFCNQHLPFKDFVNDYNKTQRVCAECHKVIQREAYLQRVAWRLHKVQCFFDGTLHSLLPDAPVDSNLEKAKRGLAAVVIVAKSTPLGGTYGTLIKGAAQGVDFLIQHGGLTLKGLMLSPQFTEAAATLKAMAGKDIDISMMDLVLGMYYLSATRRFEKGQDPDKVQRDFADYERVPNDVMHDLLAYAQLGVKFPYITVEADLQRVLELQGYDMLFAKLESVVHQPAYYLAANRSTKTVFLGIRGTKSLDDVLTDLAADPVLWPPHDYDKQHDAEEKEASTAPVFGGTQYVHAGLGQAALWLFEELVFTLQELQDKGFAVVVSGHSLAGGVAALLTVLLRPYVSVRCYSFAPPACVGPVIAESCRDLVTSVTLCDDVVPRLSIASATAIVLELSKSKEHFKQLFEEDKRYTTQRVAHVWIPRVRHKGILGQSIQSSFKAVTHTPATTVPAVATTTVSAVESATATTTTVTTTVIEPPAENLQNEEKSVPMEFEAKMHISSEVKPSSEDEGKRTHDQAASQLTVPGNRIHIYFWRGVPQAVYLPPGQCLDAIELSSDILNHHLGGSYIHAIQDVVRGRKAEWLPPPWEAFNMESLCACCLHDFTWASTSHSAAQQSFDRHHCHRCGSVVCGACSINEEPIPLFGIHRPVRVCDKCHQNLSGFDDPAYYASQA